MAIGGLISNRNFGSLIGSGVVSSGKVCPIERAVSRHRGERSGIASAQYAQGSIFYENSLSSGFSYSSFLQVAGYLDEFFFKPLATYPLQRRGSANVISLQIPHSADGFNVTKGNTRTTMMLRRMESELKSEEDDMTEAAAVDSLESTEGEAVLASPWWEQFPKRWVIVLLCFTAFLLCNMDRILCVRDNSSWKLG